MVITTCPNATLQVTAGMAPYLNEVMRITSPAVRRRTKRHRHAFTPSEQYYWLVRTAVNYLLDVGRGRDVVVGVAVVFPNSAVLSAFTQQFERLKTVPRDGSLACYMLMACAVEEGIWALKITQEVT